MRRFLKSISPHVKDVVYKRNDHFVAVAPKGLGTNVVMDMAVLRAMSLPKTPLANVSAKISGHLPTNARCKILFISSLQERYQQRLQEWKLKYESILFPGWSRALKVGELSESTISHCDIFCTTPSQFDAFCRRFLVPLTPQAAQEMSSFGLVLIEDIHLVGSSQEGLRLEYFVVSRLKMLSKLPDMSHVSQPIMFSYHLRNTDIFCTPRVTARLCCAAHDF
jgi:replicative superfamily II helicase